jgi:hypothetical protein
LLGPADNRSSIADKPPSFNVFRDLSGFFKARMSPETNSSRDAALTGRVLTCGE